MNVSFKTTGCLLCLAAAGVLATGTRARADLLNFGASYTISGSAFAGGDFTNTPLVLSPSAQTFDDGTLQITERTTALSGGAEFAEFYITSVTPGAPLVGPGGQNSEFSIFLNSIPLTAPAVSSNYYYDFTTRGVADEPITASGGLGTESNPNSGSVGAGQAAFDFPGTRPSTGTTSGYGFFETPYAYENSLTGTDDHASGYFLGIELTPVTPVTAAPEPATLALLSGCVFGLGLIRRSRRGEAAGPEHG